MEGRECYLLELEIERESPYKRIWVDKDMLFLVQAEGDSSDGNNVRTTFSDFRKAKDSWELPYKIEVFINGEQTMTVLTKSLEINKGLSDDLFDVNKVKVSGPNMQEMMQNMMKPGGNN
ncbi:MAG: outer membrane lipoprotein-sorting protein [Candidatus Caldatribacteriota bacterium]|nr:outer membrane lipoprotein-sorting protein [Candidatus Caldatribacteriota bacterium]